MLIVELAKNFKWFVLNKRNEKWLKSSEEELRNGLVEWFENTTDEKLDLDNPISFNQKIQWLKLYDSTEKKALLADKLAVREWIKETIGQEYLIPLIGVWDRFEDIDFNKLPDRFVLKTNHGSSTNVIVTDKTTVNKTDLYLKFKRWLSTNYALIMGFELHYGMIPPKIICEEYMGNDLTDYKLFCFNGKPDFFWVDTGRYTNHKRNTYDLEWHELEFTIDNFERCSISRPRNLKLMIELATKLSKDFSFVRVDFYEIDGRLYFGEMTFTSSSGRDPFNPSVYNTKYGEKLKLPPKTNIDKTLANIKKCWRI